ncbi:MAG: hypothetical protein R2708_05255 [Vicinamibacterales bacterium]
MLRTWGGPGDGYTWYDQEHGIYIDHNGFVWTGTDSSMHVMKFTQDGRHVLTIGEPGINKNNNDRTTWAGRPTSTSSRRPMRSSSPTATSTGGWWSTTPPPASTSGTGAPTAGRRTTRRVPTR